MSNDSWRPKLHLAPYKGSISDPNGMCQFKGTYNFFCQNAPEYPGNFDSPHGWGHFASRDLVNWVFLGCHVMPDSPADKDGSYSGGAYINEEADQLWLYYTGNVRDGEGDGTTSGRLANQTLMKSYNGINLGAKEVVLDNSGYPAYCSCHVRDPKVWKQDGKLHMMLGARTLADSRGSIMMYDSEDGYTWTMAGSVTNLEEKPFGYMWECPDRIVLDGKEFLSTCPQGMAGSNDPDDPSRVTAQNVHAAGYFPIEGTIVDLMHQDTERMDAAAPHAAMDEKTFIDWDYGFDYYACQSLVDEKGRTILIGWMSLPHDADDVRAYDNPTSTWRGALT
ncbi:MAG: glycoside hydrolase family 32 protein, partial [Atopobiaceae bacterium]|nr:glycoside hydrolase family 32 protein [Atopobiaceae bacterium]